MVAFLDVLLGVIPCAACVGHEHCHHNAGDECACKQTAESGRSEDEADCEGNDNCHKTGNKHFLESCGGGDGNALLVVGLALAFHDAGDLTELTANLFDHLVSCLGNGVHGHCGEDEGKHTADEQTDDDCGIKNADTRLAELNKLASNFYLCCLCEGDEQCEGGQSGGADSEALAHCCGGVADCIELVGDLTDGVVETAHLGDTAGVVGDRTVSVDRNGDTGGGEHTDCCKCDTVEVGALVGNKDSNANQNDGDPGGHHADCNAGDDGRSRTGLGLMCNLLNGLVIAGGVDLGDDADDETDSKTGDDRPCGIVAAEHGLAQNYGSHNDEQSGNV